MVTTPAFSLEASWSCVTVRGIRVWIRRFVWQIRWLWNPLKVRVWFQSYSLILISPLINALSLKRKICTFEHAKSAPICYLIIIFSLSSKNYCTGSILDTLNPGLKSCIISILFKKFLTDWLIYQRTVQATGRIQNIYLGGASWKGEGLVVCLQKSVKCLCTN